MKYYVPAILWSLLILGLSTMAGVNLPESFWDIIAWDKVGHAFVYGVQTALIYYAFQSANEGKGINQKMVLIGLFISILYGIGMEVIQYSFFPNRYFEVLDIIANIIGSLFGLYLYRKYYLNT